LSTGIDMGILCRYRLSTNVDILEIHMPNTALVTGASSGIGREFARYHASKGGDLIITARRIKELDALKDELEKKHGVSVMTVPLDLAAKGGAKALYEEIRAKDRHLNQQRRLWRPRKIP
jgi:short-subunit dehydrogenase